MTESLDLSLDSNNHITFVTPNGRYILPRDAVNFSPILQQLLSFYPNETEFNLVEHLQIIPAYEQTDEQGRITKFPAHTLYQIPEHYYRLVFTFFQQLYHDQGIIPLMPGSHHISKLSGEEQKTAIQELAVKLQNGKTNPFPERVTVFDPTSPNVLPQSYWNLVKDLSIEDLSALDYVALNFGNYAFSKLIELAVAFWIARNKDLIKEKYHLLEWMIQRDKVMKDGGIRERFTERWKSTLKGQPTKLCYDSL